MNLQPTNNAIYLNGMSDQDIAWFRAQACQEQAERAVDPLDKEAWMGLAGGWIRLAQEVEERGVAR